MPSSGLTPNTPYFAILLSLFHPKVTMNLVVTRMLLLTRFSGQDLRNIMPASVSGLPWTVFC